MSFNIKSINIDTISYLEHSIFLLPVSCIKTALKKGFSVILGKVAPQGAFWQSWSFDQIAHAPGAKPWHYIAEPAISELSIHTFVWNPG